jgi:hypothetical protein
VLHDIVDQQTMEPEFADTNPDHPGRKKGDQRFPISNFFERRTVKPESKHRVVSLYKNFSDFPQR